MTKTEERENNLIVSMGCLACKQFGTFSPAGIHHVRKLATSKKRSRAPKIPLCGPHHQDHGCGISLHDGEETWQETFGEVLWMVAEVEGFLTAKGHTPTWKRAA